MQTGWDISARVAQLANHPQDIEALRAALSAQMETHLAHIEADPGGSELQTLHEDPAAWQDHHRPLPAAPAAPGWQDQEDAAAGDDEQELGSLPPWTPASLQLKLYDKDAAHTLEAGPHRRGCAFMGAHVVTVESARALPSLSGGGYDWSRKLAVQLTPEEMPAALAVLMNLAESVRFGQHGAERDKFVELRRQAGGLVVVTGQGGSVYAVPVKTRMLYHLLSLFARAMAEGLPTRSVADVLALVRASQ